jgi:thiol-disulfide isomerase/thioredoxin
VSSTSKRATTQAKSTTRSTNRTWWVVIGLVVVIGIAAVIAAAGSGGGSGNGGAATAHETGAVQVVGNALPAYADPSNDTAIGKTMPTLHGISFDGSPVTIEPNGKPQAIVFLSHSCPHCQAEMPRIVALSKQGKLAGVDVTAVTTNTSPDLPNYPPSAWLKSAGWPYPVLADSKNADAASAYGLTAFPYFVFVDSQGKVVLRGTGEVTDDSLVKVFKALASGEATGSPSNGASTPAGQ